MLLKKFVANVQLAVNTLDLPHFHICFSKSCNSCVWRCLLSSAFIAALVSLTLRHPGSAHARDYAGECRGLQVSPK